MPTKKASRKTTRRKKRAPVRLKDVAESLGVSTATVSLILNRSPAAKSIPEETHRRVRAAAEKLGYRPNQLARSLRSNRTQTIGVLVPEISEGYEAAVLAGIEEQLQDDDYFYFVSSHGADAKRMQRALETFEDRHVEGLILANTQAATSTTLPTVTVSGEGSEASGPAVVLDHSEAARLAIDHLWSLGHRDIAFFRGPKTSADAAVRWRAISQYARDKGIAVRDELIRDLGAVPVPTDQDDSMFRVSEVEVGSQEGYVCTLDLLASRSRFTALLSFNDLSAIGAARALSESNRFVPHDVSLVGFDDILSASFHIPPLTTVRQPLRRMGRLAARKLLALLAQEPGAERVDTVAPELIVRKSTGTPMRPLT